MDADLLTAMKALSDASRLRIVGALADGRPLTVEQLAKDLSLSPGTVVHHLKRLRDAGLVESTPRRPYVDYSLRLVRLAELGARLSRMASQMRGDEPPAKAPKWAGPEEAKILRSFFDGDLLTSIPAQRAKRLVVLRQLAETVFERKHKYPEKEANQRLAARYPDAASLRRYLVDEGFMSRKQSVYKLRPRSAWPVLGTNANDKLAAAGPQRSRARARAETATAPDA